MWEGRKILNGYHAVEKQLLNVAIKDVQIILITLLINDLYKMNMFDDS